jgi:uncharacterized membrane protein
MKRVTFANTEGNAKEVNIKISFGHLLFGPFYYLAKGMVFRGILLLLLYVVVLWYGLFDLIHPLLAGHVPGMYIDWMLHVKNFYWILVGILAVIHVLLVFITPRAVVKRLFKKGYVPYCEIDTQMLIKGNLAKVGTQCYLSSFKAIDGVQGKIKIGNSKDLQKELDELKELLKEGMITKDEYETKRAMAIMRNSNKNKRGK